MIRLLKICMMLISFIFVEACDKKSDQEIVDLIENVIGVDIPENYQVVEKKDQNVFAPDGAMEYSLSFEEEDFAEFYSGIDLSKWAVTGEVIKIPAFPDELVSIFPQSRQIQYISFRNLATDWNRKRQQNTE